MMPIPSQSGRLPATFTDELGNNDYTSIGQASGDLASAQMALDALLSRTDLTPGQRRDLRGALRKVSEAARAVERHVDHDL